VGILAINILGYPLQQQQQAHETLASVQPSPAAVAAYSRPNVNHKILISKRNAWSMS